MSAKPKTKTGLPSLSIAILMFNEENNIASCLDETLAFCESSLSDWEIIVVDDGSKDGSFKVVESYAEQRPEIKLVRHVTNKGMGAGIKTAVETATKDYFLYNAADGQIDPMEINKMLPIVDGADIVLSTYSNRRETVIRELISRAFRVYMKAVANIRFKHQGLFLYPTKEAKQIVPLIRSNTFFFCFEMVQRGIEKGLIPASTKIVCRDRESGDSKVAKPGRILKVGKEALVYGITKRLMG